MDDVEPSRPDPPHATVGQPRAWAVGLFLLALMPRLYAALAFAREPVWDGHYYDFGARRIAAGLGYSDDVVVGGVSVWHPWCHYPVGYSGLLALGYRLFGDGPHVGPVLNAVIGAALVVAVYALGRRALGERRARIAALLVAAHPGLILYSAVLMTELTAALGVVLAAWVAARRAASGRSAAVAGLLCGLTTLVRPQSILLAPAIGLFGWRGPSRRARARRAGAQALVATAVALAVVSPWTIRNCRVMDGCAFVSTNVGWNLAIGAFPRATGRFETLRGSDGCPVVTGQVQQDRCWLAVGLEWIRSDPWRWLGLVPLKLGLTFDHESFPVGYLAEADPTSWPPPKREATRQALTWHHRVLLALAPLGLVARPPRGRAAAPCTLLAMLAALAWLAVADVAHPFWPFAVAIPVLAALPLSGRAALGPVLGFIAWSVATVIVTHAVFFGEDRYHLVTSPLLCLLVAAALRPPRTPDARHGPQPEAAVGRRSTASRA